MRVKDTKLGQFKLSLHQNVIVYVLIQMHLEMLFSTPFDVSAKQINFYGTI